MIRFVPLLYRIGTWVVQNAAHRIVRKLQPNDSFVYLIFAFIDCLSFAPITSANNSDN